MSGAFVPPAEPARLARLVAERMRAVPDFPTAGVLFRDLTPLFADPDGFRAVVDGMAAQHEGAFDVVAGVEARGFLLAAAIAYATGSGVVPIRKQGKLPGPTLAASYTLEYGSAVVEVAADAFARSRKVLLVDDVLATGGTLRAAADLVGRAGATVSGVSVVLELSALAGRTALTQQVHSVLSV